ncbi:MAG TPA: hypothetical protein G4O10_04870 [Dehalococcoidia bacterium]|nr:hypothetical protein [Dehalococcoidia bacterium]
MKRKILLLGLVLTLILTMVMPATALAAKPPAPTIATGEITDITFGDVFPAGNSGRWIVQEREISGNISGALNGAFTMTYKANVVLVTQAGNFHGTFEADNITLNVNGKISPLELVPVEVDPDVFVDLPMLSLSGHWNVIDGAKGNGNFDAYLVFIPDAQGHVGTIVASGIVMTGKWQP